MKNSVFTVLTQAIDAHRLIGVVDEAGPRILEPYLIFESSQGDLLLHGWQRAGAFRETPPPRWCNLHLDDLASVEILDDHFAQPRPDYNPHGPAFHRVVYALESKRCPLPATKAARAPTKRSRHRPPVRTARVRHRL
jgi:hypothetical protein